jgi:hypothetical protein
MVARTREPKRENDLTLLRPELMYLASAIVDLANGEDFPVRALPNGYRARIIETYRTPERQEWLMRNRPGSTKVKLGYHSFGCAFDFVILDKRGRCVWTNENGVYSRVGYLAKAFGCKWPTQWRDKRGRLIKDLGHVEWRTKSLAELRKEDRA